MTQKNEKVEKISLSEAVTHLLEECRMVLPGIQTLFDKRAGFFLRRDVVAKRDEEFGGRPHSVGNPEAHLDGAGVIKCEKVGTAAFDGSFPRGLFGI